MLHNYIPFIPNVSNSNIQDVLNIMEEFLENSSTDDIEK